MTCSWQALGVFTPDIAAAILALSKPRHDLAHTQAHEPNPEQLTNINDR